MSLDISFVDWSSPSFVPYEWQSDRCHPRKGNRHNHQQYGYQYLEQRSKSVMLRRILVDRRQDNWMLFLTTMATNLVQWLFWYIDMNTWCWFSSDCTTGLFLLCLCRTNSLEVWGNCATRSKDLFNELRTWKSVYLGGQEMSPFLGKDTQNAVSFGMTDGDSCKRDLTLTDAQVIGVTSPFLVVKTSAWFNQIVWRGIRFFIVVPFYELSFARDQILWSHFTPFLGYTNIFKRRAYLWQALRCVACAKSSSAEKWSYLRFVDLWAGMIAIARHLPYKYGVDLMWVTAWPQLTLSFVGLLVSQLRMSWSFLSFLSYKKPSSSHPSSLYHQAITYSYNLQNVALISERRPTTRRNAIRSSIPTSKQFSGCRTLTWFQLLLSH